MTWRQLEQKCLSLRMQKNSLFLRPRLVRASEGSSLEMLPSSLTYKIVSVLITITMLHFSGLENFKGGRRLLHLCKYKYKCSLSLVSMYFGHISTIECLIDCCMNSNSFSHCSSCVNCACRLR